MSRVYQMRERSRLPLHMISETRFLRVEFVHLGDLTRSFALSTFKLADSCLAIHMPDGKRFSPSDAVKVSNFFYAYRISSPVLLGSRWCLIMHPVVSLSSNESKFFNASFNVGRTIDSKRISAMYFAYSRALITKPFYSLNGSESLISDSELLTLAELSS